MHINCVYFINYLDLFHNFISKTENLGDEDPSGSGSRFGQGTRPAAEVWGKGNLFFLLDEAPSPTKPE